MQAEKIDFERVTAGLRTKSDKIRALSRHGVPTAEIARFLGIRYQHARNVLVEAGLHRAGEEAGALAVSRERRSTWGVIEADGSLLLPADLMKGQGLAPGARVYVGRTGDGLEVLSQQAALARAQAIAAPYRRPGVSEVDGFIAERRREAACEERGE